MGELKKISCLKCFDTGEIWDEDMQNLIKCDHILGNYAELDPEDLEWLDPELIENWDEEDERD